ncbi:MAG: peptidylprolyl isomerase [Clostridia bacterium]|nr:peptidylprolyl isomerase [Clostridia bacterium]
MQLKKHFLRVLLLCLSVTLLMGALSACNQQKEDIPYDISETETDYVVISVKNYGSIVVKLYPDVAPKTVANFKKLVSQGFYDGLIFHRVIESFMIQGGDPLGTGYGGSEETIVGEFAANGFDNTLGHKRGVISMARSGVSYDSASSQFFICHKTTVSVENLNGNYAAFGEVVYGMDVVDAIASVKTNSNDKPTTDVVMTSIRFCTPSLAEKA